MRAALVCALLALLLGLAAAQIDVSPWLVQWRPEEIELCVLVGENSGCSGCSQGTKGLCRWVEVAQSHSVPPQGRDNTVLIANPAPGRVSYQCLPNRWFMEAQNVWPDTFFDGSYLCPANPKREPIVRDNATDSINSFVFPIKKAHVVLSKTHHRKLIDFPTSNWTVDRFSRYGVLGGLTAFGSVTNGVGGFEHFSPTNDAYADCAQLNSAEDSRPSRFSTSYIYRPRAGEDSEVFYSNRKIDNLLAMCPYDGSQYGPIGTEYPSPNINTPFWRETEKWCTRTYLNAYASTRCPQYGVAVSGICQSTFWRFFFNCRDSHVLPQFGGLPLTNIAVGSVNTTLGAIPPPPLPFGPIMMMRTVADGTPFCLDEMPLEITGEFEGLAGLHKSIPFLNSWEGFECYDCCDGVDE